MFSFKKITIGKKVTLISAFALIGMVVIIGLSLVFFGQIGDISQLSGQGGKYRLLVYEAALAFEHYTRTQAPADFETYNESAETVTAMDNVPGWVYRSMQTHDGVDAIISEYKRTYGAVHPDAPKIATLFQKLKGKPQLSQIVKYTEEAHANGVKKHELAKAYHLAGSDAEKTRILSEIDATDKKQHQAVADYQGVLDGLADYLKATIVKIFISIGVLIMIVLAAMTFFVVRAITAPLKSTVAFAHGLAQGDLTRKLAIQNKDELGEMGDSLNQMSTDLGAMLREIKQGVETLSSASTELSSISVQMTDDTKETSRQSDDVTAAAGKMNDKMDAVAAAMEQSSTNANLVASAAEEMSATIDEISKNAERARSTSEDANEKTNQATLLMNELGGAADAIGKVIETITDISEQVNLLALNATIEAARAGEAGKGFAVVANEIKELARQTADATQDIKQKITTIQDTTTTTISQTQEVSAVIGNVNDVIAGIATAVEEQSDGHA